MKIRIDDIPEGGAQLSFSGSEDILSEYLETIPAASGVSIDPHILGNLLILGEGTKVHVTGTVHAHVRLQCARCLTEFPVEKTLTLALLVERGDYDTPLHEEREEFDENTVFVEGPFLDVSELIVQEILLDIPMKPLCNDACPGLCQRCGALKGSPECTCPRETTLDPRWDALARLKKEMPS